jgi:hypothetical protein
MSDGEVRVFWAVGGRGHVIVEREELTERQPTAEVKCSTP